MKWFRAAAVRGNQQGEEELARIYLKGLGTPVDVGEAMTWLRKVADQGGPLGTDAEATIGKIYFTGEGVPQNYAEAADWYLRAANSGEPNSQLRLGLMFEQGQGVNADPVQAYAWFSVVSLNLKGLGGVAEQMVAFATKHRDALGERMTAAQLTEAQRLANDVWLSKMHGKGLLDQGSQARKQPD